MRGAYRDQRVGISMRGFSNYACGSAPKLANAWVGRFKPQGGGGSAAQLHQMRRRPLLPERTSRLHAMYCLLVK